MEMKKQPTGYNFEVKGKIVKEHECPICLMLIRDATELPCSHLMCKNCLVYYEEKALESAENATFLCSLCQEAYCRKKKKEVKSIDRIIRESIDVKCKNWIAGCRWDGCISNYENHHVNVCKFIPVVCPNEGCTKQLQRKELKEHEKSCEYRIVPCEYCEKTFLNYLIKSHHETCQLYPIACINPNCEENVQRKYIKKHCEKECKHQVVDCVYHVLGCTVKEPRYVLKDHLHEKTDYHSFLLLKSHLDLSKKNENHKKHLEDLIKEQSKAIENLASEVGTQCQTLDKKIINLETTVEKQDYATSKLKDEIQISTIGNLRKRIENIEGNLRYLQDTLLMQDQSINALSTRYPNPLERRITDLETSIKFCVVLVLALFLLIACMLPKLKGIL